MAQKADMWKLRTILWKTERPSQDKSRISRDFSLLEDMWYLKIEYFNGSWDNNTKCFLDYCKLSLVHKESKTSRFYFDVTTYIQTSGSYNQVFPNRGSTSRLAYSLSQTIWSCDKTSVSDAIPGFYDYSDLYVVCTFRFYGSAASLGQILNETRHFSTQTDLDELSTTLQDCSIKREGTLHAHVLRETPCELEILSDDFNNLLDQKNFADLKLVCGGCSFSVHGYILAARSDVFADKLRTELKSVDIPDVEGEILELMLKYIYTGKISNVDDESAPRLFKAGSRYAVHGLQKACSEWMVRNLSEQNCVSFLNVADEQNGDDAFKNAVVAFIIRHPDVLQTKKWLKFSEASPKLGLEVYQNFVSSVLVKNSQSD